jgi:hypothetical protein
LIQKHHFHGRKQGLWSCGRPQLRNLKKTQTNCGRARCRGRYFGQSCGTALFPSSSCLDLVKEEEGKRGHMWAVLSIGPDWRWCSRCACSPSLARLLRTSYPKPVQYYVGTRNRRRAAGFLGPALRPTRLGLWCVRVPGDSCGRNFRIRDPFLEKKKKKPLPKIDSFFSRKMRRRRPVRTRDCPGDSAAWGVYFSLCFFYFFF